MQPDQTHPVRTADKVHDERRDERVNNRLGVYLDQQQRAHHRRRCMRLDASKKRRQSRGKLEECKEHGARDQELELQRRLVSGMPAAASSGSLGPDSSGRDERTGISVMVRLEVLRECTEDRPQARVDYWKQLLDG